MTNKIEEALEALDSTWNLVDKHARCEHDTDGLLLVLGGHFSKIREAHKSMQWQPIETAPEDGTHIVLYDESLTPIEDKHITTGFWDEHRWSQWDSEDYTPTHWMPVPQPPNNTPLRDESEEK